MDVPPTLELLESTHTFPGVYQIKAIGRNSTTTSRRPAPEPPSGPSFRARPDPGRALGPLHAGRRHVAVTLDVNVESADQVRRLYARIHAVEGPALSPLI